MDNEHTILLSVNRNTQNIQSQLMDVYREILNVLYDYRNPVISIDNEDWLWLIDHWASFYLSGTYRQVPSQTLLERLLVWLKIRPKYTNITYSIDADYLKKLRNEMSDGKYLLVNGRMVPVKVT